MAVPRTLEDLNQHPVFSYFLWLCEIPHATFKEKALSNAIYTWAKRHEKWMSWQDTHHNLYIRKPATPGYEAKPALLFQAHLDMVCVAAPDVIHNFDKDPLTLALEGDRLTTGGRTTLGADDGIGVALAMALLDDETQAHPEIEVLFTTAEEEDFSGAAAADIDWFHAHQLINIDNARENHATTGSAGGYGIHYERPVIPEKPGKNLTYFKIGVGGMMGGHSGEDIHRGRGSAIRLLSRMLFAARRAIPIQLAGLTGGVFRLAIAREASAVIGVPAHVTDGFLALMETMEKALTAEYKGANPRLFFTKTPVAADEIEAVLSVKETKALIQFLILMPQGVMEMNGEVPGVVQTSINTGKADLDLKKGLFTTESEVRSSFDSQRDVVKYRFDTLIELLGGKLAVYAVYPGWPNHPDSKIKDLVTKTYAEVFHRELAATPVHVGLECGFFLQKRPDLDCISIGPDAGNLHSPEEWLSIPSTMRMFEFIKEIVRKVIE